MACSGSDGPFCRDAGPDGSDFSFLAQSPFGLVISATDDTDADGRKESDLVSIDNDC